MRNRILHNYAMKLTEQEIQDFINTVKQMLSDSKYLASNPEAIYAIHKLDVYRYTTNLFPCIPHAELEDVLIDIGGNMSFFPLKQLGHGLHAVVFEGRFGMCYPKQIAVKVVTCLSEQAAIEIQEEVTDIHRKIKPMETINIQSSEQAAIETQKGVTDIYRETKAMETINIKSMCPNIIHNFNSFIDANKVYMAFELANGTLHNYVADSKESNDLRQHLPCSNVIVGIVAGLNFTHQKKIVHRDLKPANIFIVEESEKIYKAVIGDYGSAKPTQENTFTLTGKMGSPMYIAPEIWRAITAKDADETSVGSRCSNQSDIFSLGLVIYFALSLGKHPYGNEHTAQAAIGKASLPNFRHISSQTNSFAYIDMLRPMLNDLPNERSSIEEVSEHPALLTSEKVMEFFVNKSDEFEIQIKADSSKENLLEDPSLVTNKDWMNQLPVDLQTYLRSYTLTNRKQPLYKGKETSIRHLLRCIRNTNAHHTEYSKDAQTNLGHCPDGHVKLWLKVCPKLLMHVFNKLGSP